MANTEELRLEPITDPADAVPMTRMSERSFADDLMQQHILLDHSESAIAANFEFRTGRLRSRISGKEGFDPYFAKVVTDVGGQDQIVGWAGWQRPRSPDRTRSKMSDAEKLEFKDRQRDSVRGRIDTDFMDMVDALLVGKSAELLGADRDDRYWYLGALTTDPDFQRRGIGSRLVAWGANLAEEDARQRPDLIKGYYCVATPAGLQTYLRNGMKPIGEELIKFELNGKPQEVKFVWLAHKF